MKTASAALPFLCATAIALSQQPQQTQARAMGSVLTTDAQVTGTLDVQGPRARLLSNAGVTAFDHTARIELDRGGLVQVCATSGFHLLRSGANDALLFALDRGAMEILSSARAQDSVITPDLRIDPDGPGVFDLRMRVTRNGDTCIDNRGSGAPALHIAATFGDATYRLAPGQHVLFEHGDLHQVVDNERSPCGCPPDVPAASANGVATGTQPTPAQTAALHPFPAAQSQDLAPASASAPPPQTTGETQVAAQLAFNEVQPVRDSTTPAPSAGTASAQTVASPSQPPPAPPGAKDLAHIVGGFFRKLFGHKQSKS